MITGMDSDVALTGDEQENDDVDSDSDFETINMDDLDRIMIHHLLLLIGIPMISYQYLKYRQLK